MVTLLEEFSRPLSNGVPTTHLVCPPNAYVGRAVTGALSHLQLARARKRMGDEAATRKSYEDFLTLWKDADPEIPIYQQAQAEYAERRKP